MNRYKKGRFIALLIVSTLVLGSIDSSILSMNVCASEQDEILGEDDKELVENAENESVEETEKTESGADDSEGCSSIIEEVTDFSEESSNTIEEVTDFSEESSNIIEEITDLSEAEEETYDDGFSDTTVDEFGDSVQITGSISGMMEINQNNFPDPIFREYFISHYCGGDSTVSVEYIRKLSGIDIEADGIKDFTGIEYLIGLDTFICQNAQAETIDLSKCRKLKWVLATQSSFRYMNLSGCQALKVLNVADNYLEKLDVSKNTKLVSLNCSNNKLTSLDISNNKILQDVDCSNNQLSLLKTGNNSKMIELICNENKLEGLNLNGAISLETLICNQNNLSVLDVQKLTKLDLLKCSNTNIEKLDLSKNTELDYIDCSSCKLSTLDLSNNPKVNFLYCGENKFAFFNKETQINALAPLSRFEVDGSLYESNTNAINYEEKLPGFDPDRVVEGSLNNVIISKEDKKIEIIEIGKVASYNYRVSDSYTETFEIFAGDYVEGIVSLIPTHIVLNKGESYNYSKYNTATEKILADDSSVHQCIENKNGAIVASKTYSGTEQFALRYAKMINNTFHYGKPFWVTFEVIDDGEQAPQCEDIFVASQGIKTLSEINLPSELYAYEWENSKQSITEYKGNTVVFPAVRKESEKEVGKLYAPANVTVHFTEAVQILCDSPEEWIVESNDQQLDISITDIYSNGTPDGVKYRLLESKNAIGLDIKPKSEDAPNVFVVKPLGIQGNATLQLRVDIFVLKNGKEIILKSKNITIQMIDISKHIECDYAINDIAVEAVPYEVKQGDIIQFANLKACNVGSNEGVKISSTNNKIANVKKNNVSLVGIGDVTITLSSVVDNRVKKQLHLLVSPVNTALITKRVTLNRAIGEYQNIDFAIAYGKKITDFTYTRISGNGSLDIIMYGVDAKQLIKVNVPKYSEIGTTVYMLQFKYNEDDEWIPAEGTLIVKAVDIPIKYTAKQEKKLNKFYVLTDTQGKITNIGEQHQAIYNIECKEEIRSIASDSEDYTITYDSGKMLVGLSDKAMGKTWKEISPILNYTVKYKVGWYAKSSKSIKVNSGLIKPQITVTAQNQIMYQRFQMTETRITITCNGTKILATDTNYSVAQTENSVGFDLMSEGDDWILKTNSNSKKRVRLRIMNDEWKEPQEVNVTIGVSNKIPKLVAEKSQQTLNSKYATTDLATYKLRLDNKPASIGKVKILGFTKKGLNQKSKVYEEYFRYDYYSETNSLLIDFKNKDEVTPNGSYSYSFVPLLGYEKDGELHTLTLAPMKLTVKVVNNTATVSGKSSGVIDPLHRSSSVVTVKLQQKGLRGVINKVSIIGENCNTFEVVNVQNEIATIKAKKDASLKSGYSYSLSFRVTCEDEGERKCTLTTKAIKIKVQQAKQKLISEKQIAFGEVPMQVDLTTKIKYESSVDLEVVAIEDASKLFVIEDVNRLNIKEGISASKITKHKYTVYIYVKPLGSAVNVEPTRVKMDIVMNYTRK